jgi:hypothetical protein
MSRFSADSIGFARKGAASRPEHSSIQGECRAFPELNGLVDTTMNQDAVKQKIEEVADSLPDDQKTATDQPLPTGIDKSIEPMLPDPIYIPAVKDLADDIKTTESTPFGKILAILLQAIEPKLPEAHRLFEDLNTKLNRVQQPDGAVVDGRLDEVKADRDHRREVRPREFRRCGPPHRDTAAGVEVCVLVGSHLRQRWR